MKLVQYCQTLAGVSALCLMFGAGPRANTTATPIHESSDQPIGTTVTSATNQDFNLPDWCSDSTAKANAEKFKADNNKSPFQLLLPHGFGFYSGHNYFSDNYYFSEKQKRKDDTAASMMLSIVPLQKEKQTRSQQQQDSIRDCLKALIDGAHRFKTNKWKEGAVETGKIDGRVFVRQRWTASDGASDWSGVAYVGKDGDTMIIAQTSDKNPYYKKTLKQTEAAILSMKFIESAQAKQVASK